MDASVLEFDEGSHEVGTWDQFAVNRALFGVQSTYEFEIYTSKLDPTKSKYTPLEAERIAQEIQQSSTKNIHLADERGQFALDDSGVI